MDEKFQEWLNQFETDDCLECGGSNKDCPECKGFGFYNKDGELYNRDEMRKFFDGEWA